MVLIDGVGLDELVDLIVDKLAQRSVSVDDGSIDRVVDRVASRMERQYVSVDEYAKMLGISRRTVDRAIAEGRLEVERSGWRISIDRNARITK